jgi:hypothetical protein
MDNIENGTGFGRLSGILTPRANPCQQINLVGRNENGRCPQRVKLGSRALNVHRNTVRNWARNGGLTAMMGSRPHLILGAMLIEFLKKRQPAQKRKCGWRAVLLEVPRVNRRRTSIPPQLDESILSV